MTKHSCLNPWTSPTAYFGLVCVGAAACLFAIHPFIGFLCGTPIAFIGLAAAAAVQERTKNVHAVSGNVTFRLVSGACLLGLLLAAISAGSILADYFIAQGRSQPAGVAKGLLQVFVFALMPTAILVTSTARAQQTRPQQCWLLALYWLSFVPVAVLAVWAFYRRGTFWH